MSRSRDIASIMGATEAINTNNAALLDSARSPVGSGGGVDSATTLDLVDFEKGVFRINGQTLDSNHTIDSADNAMSAGPITVDSGVTLTVNGYWSVV